MTAAGPVRAADTDGELAALEHRSAPEVVRWAVDRFGDGLIVLCSGQDAVLVDVALGVDPTIEVAFLDTGFHFPETIETMLAIAERYRPRLRVVAPWRHLPGVGGSGFCCGDHKVEQLDWALAGRTAWLSGLRRADSAERRGEPVAGLDRRGLVKLNPLAAWSDAEVEAYIADRDVIVNPLRDRGYPSIGCWPCTSPVDGPAEARSGRWAGTGRTECGIHT
jgi:phosphoadenosine phosphosulfate reductase